MQVKYFYFFILLISSSCDYAMESDAKKQFYSIVVPDLNNKGGESYYDNKIINTPYKMYDSLGYGRRSAFSDLMKIDFGQKHCVQYFQEQLDSDPMLQQSKKPKIIFCGIGQGGPTILNWLTELPEQQQKQLVGCLVLESVLGSGNSALIHTAQSNTCCVAYLPFVRHWGPWAAKLLSYPHYNPCGPQLLPSLQKLSPDIPVIIKHNVSDTEFTVNDARRAYCVLRENNNGNAYLLETESVEPVSHNILNHDVEKKKKIAVIQKIYKKYNLPHNKEAKKNAPHIDLNDFQPAGHDVQNKIEESIKADERVRDNIDNAAFLAIAMGSGLVFGNALNYYK